MKPAPMIRAVAIGCAILALGACNATPNRSFAATGGVQPGLAACLGAIGRPDVAADPNAPMSTAEISALVGCTANRATP